MRRRHPEARPGIAILHSELGISEPLPLAEMLLRQVRLDDDAGAGDGIGAWQPCAHDSGCRHMRALERARDPDGVLRQALRQAGKGCLVAAIAGKVALAVAAPLIDGDGRVPHPPPSRQLAHAAPASKMTISPVCSIAPKTSPV